MYTLYTILFYLALPVITLRLFWRSLRAPGYRQRILQRFGYYRSKPLDNTIWLHAVSYGEVVASEPLILKLREDYPTHPLVVTTMTATGSARVVQRFGDTVHHFHVPYDFPGAVHRFLNHFKPTIAIIMETEIWPTIIRSSNKRDIPILIVNARLSDRAFKSYLRFQRFIKHAVQQITFIAAQSQLDADRFIQLGATPQHVANTGNIKFDFNPSQNQITAGLAWRDQVGTRPIWIAASTHAGEEEIVLAAHRIILAEIPDALLILVPRHPERFSAVEKLCCESEFNTARRSQHDFPTADNQIYLVDRMGELTHFYSASDVAFVGGSLVPIGGHNVLEAAVCDTPIITGPHMNNSQAIWDTLRQEKACITVHNQDELATSVLHLLRNKQAHQEYVNNAKKVLTANQGTLNKLTALIQQHIKA